jgi:peptidoglycan/xylan/chitin deacetylase (PgdA/CDA1 family)
MRVCFVFDRAAWQEPAVRFAIETLAPLLETPWRSITAGEGCGSGDAPVFVGAPGDAPRDCAAVIPVEDWPRWDLATLRIGRFEGEPLVCPRGEFPPPASESELPTPWLRSIAFMLCRDEELLDPRRDQWECFSGFYSRLHDLGLVDRPLVNIHARQLRRLIAAWCARRGAELEMVPLWKDGARFAVALTHDVDDLEFYSLKHAFRLLRQAREPSSYAFRAGLATAARTLRRGLKRGDPYWNFDRWAAEEGRHGFRSTFFFCPPDPRLRHEYDPTYRTEDTLEFEGARIRLARMLEILAERGWEVGLHGSYESHQDAEELGRQKAQIERAAGCTIAGIRQHFLRFDVRATWAAQREAGFAYDCTLGYNEAIGFRAGIAAPFHPWDVERHAPHALLELPLTIMDGTLFRTLGLDGAKAARATREHLEEVEKVGGLAVLLWHPNAADEEHFPGWWSSYRETLEHLAGREAWVTTAGEIARWWREREARMDASATPARA